MHVRLVRPRELTLSEVDSWRQLQIDAPQFRSPFLSPEFALAVDRIRRHARVAVIEDGESLAFFPHEKGALGIGRPIGDGVCDCQAVVHAPHFSWDPVKLLEDCDLAAWEFDHLLAAQEPFAPYHKAVQASPLIDLSGGFDSYLQARLQSTKKSVHGIFRQQRMLERDYGQVAFEFDAHFPEALQLVMEWKSAQYRRREWRDLFADRWIVRLMHDLVERRTSTFGGLVSLLYADGRPVAGHLGLRRGNTLSYWFPAYDSTFAKYSPGLILCLRIAEAADTVGITSIDLGKGQEPYKEMLKTSDVPIAEGWIDRPCTAATLRAVERRARASVFEFILDRPPLRRAAHNALVSMRRLKALT